MFPPRSNPPPPLSTSHPHSINVKVTPPPDGLSKHIVTQSDVELFSKSKTYKRIVDWCERASTACKSQYTYDIIKKEIPGSTVKGLCEILKKVDELVDETLIPVKNVQIREGNIHEWSTNNINNKNPLFGDLRYRDFFDKFSEASKNLVDTHLAQESNELKKIVRGYLTLSFGDRTRIDYGTGHELNFICVLLCLEMGHEGRLLIDNLDILIMNVFRTYTNVVTKLISSFRVQPAGSKGCWGLDDYFHIPFIIGASQLIDSKVSTDSVNNASEVAKHLNKSLYFEMIKYVMTVKNGTYLFENAPMLFDISGVPTWEKTQSGLVLMYCKTVLEKQPVIQHFHFSELLPWQQ